MNTRSFAASSPTSPTIGLSRWAVPAFGALTALFALAILLQVAFAGGAAFGAMTWGIHAMFGAMVVVIGLLALVAAVVAGRERRDIAATLIAFVFALLQPVTFLLASHVSNWFGMLHAADAVIIAVVLVPLVHAIVRGRGLQSSVV